MPLRIAVVVDAYEENVCGLAQKLRVGELCSGMGLPLHKRWGKDTKILGNCKEKAELLAQSIFPVHGV
jgi:hypothetical protein